MSMALSPTPVTITTGPNVPSSSPGLQFHLNASFVTSLNGLLTVSEMVLSIIVYALAVSSAFLIFHTLGSLLYIFISIAHLAIFNSSDMKAVFNADVVNAAGAMGLIAGAAHLFHVALIVKKMMS
ncbi:hypothetical protein MTO96_009607 [Rhipicephalus appendiculatus]